MALDRIPPDLHLSPGWSSRSSAGAHPRILSYNNPGSAPLGFIVGIEHRGKQPWRERHVTPPWTPLQGITSAPPSTSRLASTPGSVREPPLRSSGATQPILFRPRGFSPPRRLAPRDGLECVATRADHGVRRVSTWLAGRSLLLPRRPGFPATQLPLDEFPSLTAVPHHCGRCPPVVTAHSCRRPREVGAFEPAGA